MGIPSPIVSAAALVRVDVYAASVGCIGSSVALDAPAPQLTRNFGAHEALELQVGAGPHTVTLTAFGDVQAAEPLGRGCATVDLEAGATLCLSLDIVALDAGPDFTDGGSAGCGTSGPPTRCAGKGFAFCDGFETSSDANFPLWRRGQPVVDNYNGGAANPATALTVATTPVCAGNQAVHVHAVGAKQQAFLASVPLAQPINPLYLRTYVYLPSSSSPVPFYFLGLVNSVGTTKWLQFGIDTSSAAASFFTNSNFTTSTPTFAGPVARDRWVCVETMVRFDSSNGEVQLRVDDVTVGDVSGIATQPAGVVFDMFHLGVDSVEVPTGATFDAYFDEVVMSATPIGCL